MCAPNYNEQVDAVVKFSIFFDAEGVPIEFHAVEQHNEESWYGFIYGHGERGWVITTLEQFDLEEALVVSHEQPQRLVDVLAYEPEYYGDALNDTGWGVRELKLAVSE